MVSSAGFVAEEVGRSLIEVQLLFKNLERWSKLRTASLFRLLKKQVLKLS